MYDSAILRFDLKRHSGFDFNTFKKQDINKVDIFQNKNNNTEQNKEFLFFGTTEWYRTRNLLKPLQLSKETKMNKNVLIVRTKFQNHIINSKSCKCHHIICSLKKIAKTKQTNRIQNIYP